MQELRELFEALGFEDVRTLIQSGNVIFRSEVPPQASTLAAAIADRFEVASPVVLRTSSQLASCVARDPFGDADRAHFHVGFLAEAPSEEMVAGFGVDRFAPERITVTGTEVYFYLPGGMGNSKLAAFVSRRLGDSMTVRNWNTVVTLADLVAR